MTMNRSNHPPDHRIGKRLSRMVGCINRLTEDLPDTDPEIEWLMQSDDHDDIRPSRHCRITYYKIPY